MNDAFKKTTAYTLMAAGLWEFGSAPFHDHQPLAVHGSALINALTSSTSSLSTTVHLPADFSSFDPVPVHITPAPEAERLLPGKGSLVVYKITERT